jgi:PAS domain S-box-containing protein
MDMIPIEQVPTMIFAKDREGRYIYASPMTFEFWGIKPDEVIGKKDVEIWKEAAALISAAYVEQDQKVMRTGKPLIGIREMGLRRKGKSSIAIITNKAPLRDSNGNVIGIIAAFMIAQ